MISEMVNNTHLGFYYDESIPLNYLMFVSKSFDILSVYKLSFLTCYFSTKLSDVYQIWYAY